jgi:YidC/Oxa1 family membrane protein insertase
MERRLLVAILLTFIVLTVYQWMMPTPPLQPGAKPGSAAGAGAASTNLTDPGAQAASTATPAPGSSLPAVETVVADTAERRIVIDNGLVHAVFSNRGGVLVSWQLTQYHDAAGKPLDLVPREVPNAAKPFALKLADAAQTERVNSALYSVQPGTPDTISATATPAAVIFEYQDASGLHVRKQFRLDPNSYVVEFSPTVMNGDQSINPTIAWGPGLGDVTALANGRNVRKAEAIFAISGKSPTRVAASKLATTPHYQGVYEFAGVDTHYFISVAIKPGPGDLEYHPISLPVAGSTPPITRDYVSYDVGFQQPVKAARFFIGPKHFQTLQKADPELVRAVWFGMFAFLAVPLLSALNWINGFVGNYGWSIIVLTIIINAAMFPLRHKSFVSMKKMQAIQPQVKAIQDRYAKMKVTDPARQKMNTELMELYRSKGVNPASGCIPMLLTMPVLLAFYGLLSESIELRGAPFIFWLKDLSVADPYYVTPILMGISQIVQQKMTPMTGADPVQQKMMLFMPVVFTFLFITSPSGLALYWFFSNVLVIGQQQLTNYLIGAPTIRTPRSPADRKMKKVGESSTAAAEQSGSEPRN